MSTVRTQRLSTLEATYDAAPPQLKTQGAHLERIARALADAKRVGATTRECMDAMHSRDWSRYKKYQDYAREAGWMDTP